MSMESRLGRDSIVKSYCMRRDRSAERMAFSFRFFQHAARRGSHAGFWRTKEQKNAYFYTVYKGRQFGCSENTAETVRIEERRRGIVYDRSFQPCFFG